jgi:hypothetical protein
MTYVGRVEVRLHIFVSLELDGGVWSSRYTLRQLFCIDEVKRGAQPQYSTVKKYSGI